MEETKDFSAQQNLTENSLSEPTLPAKGPPPKTHAPSPAPELNQELNPGDVVDGYVVATILGKGGMGTVYEVQDPLTGKRAALKTLLLPADFSREEKEEHIRRFTNEAQIMWQLYENRVSYVPHIYHMPKNPLGIIMELLSGNDLEDYLRARKETRLTSSERQDLLELMGKVAETLGQAHHIGIVHRDLKPANIVIQEGAAPRSMIPVVVDFGIAKNPERQLTTSQSMMGTPSYMSPEQLMGKTAQVDGRSDIFSLGVILFRLLTGEDFYRGLLNPGAPFFERIMAQVHLLETMDTPQSPIGLRLELLEEPFREIVRRCVAFLPENRYSTMELLQKDLKEAEKDSGGSPAPVPPPSVEPATDEKTGDLLSPKNHDPDTATPPPPLSHREPPGGDPREPSHKGLLLGAAGAAIVATVMVILVMNGVFSPKPASKAPPGESNSVDTNAKTKTSPSALKETTTPKAACKLSDPKAQAACLLEQKTAPGDFAASSALVSQLLDEACGIKATLPDVTCHKLAFRLVTTHEKSCAESRGSDARTLCVEKQLSTGIFGKTSRYWASLMAALRYCSPLTAATDRPSRSQCHQLEKAVGSDRLAMYDAAHDTWEKACMLEKPQHYTENPAALMACIRNRIYDQKLSPELHFAFIQSNYERFCKTSDRYKRASKDACRLEGKIPARLRNTLPRATVQKIATAPLP